MVEETWKKVVLGLLAAMLVAGVFWVVFQLLNREVLPVLGEVEAFTLEDTEGSKYDSSNPKIKLVSFFYTNCPDICPLTMMDFTQLQDMLKEKGVFGTKVELVAITLDPEVDTVEKIKTYGGHFNADPTGWKFLRGTTSEIEGIAESYHMKFQKVSGGAIAHNTTMYLIDGDNSIRGLYNMANPKEKVDIESIMSSIQLLLSEE